MVAGMQSFLKLWLILFLVNLTDSKWKKTWLKSYILHVLTMDFPVSLAPNAFFFSATLRSIALS